MANGVQSLRSLPLSQLIGAPLVAIVEADAQAARATVDFIQTVGFIGATEAEGPAGRLRMAEFRYTKLDENNQPAEFIASVPLLSLVPIPCIQVKQARISFAAQITDIVKEQGEAAQPVEQPGSRGLFAWLRKRPVQLYTKPAAAAKARTEEIRGTYHLEIQVTLGQADIPVGMEKMFNILDQSIADRKAAPADQ